jgi:hypothetical protein
MKKKKKMYGNLENERRRKSHREINAFKLG